MSLALGELAQRRDAFDTSISRDRYLERCALKTARLFECACLLGRSESGSSTDADLAPFGREVGLAFQLLDDVLDVTGPPERTGKARGTDLLDGTVTLPLIIAREVDPALGEVKLRDLDGAGRRRSATGSQRPARSSVFARSRWSASRPRSGRSPGQPCPRRSAACSAWSRTASSSATPRACGRAVRLEVLDEDVVRV